VHEIKLIAALRVHCFLEFCK